MLVDLQYSTANLTFVLLWLKNVFSLNILRKPVLKSVSYYFVLRNLESTDNPKIYNYFYVFRYFFANAGSVRSYSSYFSLGKTYINFTMFLALTKDSLFFPIYMFTYELQPLLNLSLSRDFYLDESKFNLVLWDVNVFTDMKTNPGLFYLKDVINLSTFFCWCEFKNSKILISSLKYLIKL